MTLACGCSKHLCERSPTLQVLQGLPVKRRGGDIRVTEPRATLSPIAEGSHEDDATEERADSDQAPIDYEESGAEDAVATYFKSDGLDETMVAALRDVELAVRPPSEGSPWSGSTDDERTAWTYQATSQPCEVRAPCLQQNPRILERPKKVKKDVWDSRNRSPSHKICVRHAELNASVVSPALRPSQISSRRCSTVAVSSVSLACFRPHRFFCADQRGAQAYYYYSYYYYYYYDYDYNKGPEPSPNLSQNLNKS